MTRAVTTAVAGTTVRVGRVLAAGSAVVVAVRHLAVAAAAVVVAAGAAGSVVRRCVRRATRSRAALAGS